MNKGDRRANSHQYENIDSFGGVVPFCGPARKRRRFCAISPLPAVSISRSCDVTPTRPYKRISKDFVLRVSVANWAAKGTRPAATLSAQTCFCFRIHWDEIVNEGYKDWIRTRVARS